ncbi:MAG: tolR [Francisellaceae bacterium]|nr:tolR [Francisellaceae bacterium]
MSILSGRTKKRSMAEINIVPYVDVMLVLLVIFMITAPLLMQGVQVELPSAQSEPLKADNKPPLIVSVNEQGKLFLNTTDKPTVSLEPDQLLAQIKAELKLDPNRVVLIKGDTRADYGKIMHAMVLLKQAGINKLGLMTQPKESQTPS